ncbi:hypothetical protein [Erythrobacter sp.]|uniref:hypothetical protein n=1 Tax=Erythrobacter sp. TaxID=1042 RepID=UPI0025EEF615|nr:hypothetical protein [Erythrobacter sp.]
MESIEITGPNRVDSNGIRRLSYTHVTKDGYHALSMVVNGDREAVRKQVAKHHGVPLARVSFGPYYRDEPQPDFDYQYRQATYERGASNLVTKRFATGAAGTPNDVRVSWGGSVWFSGSANCFARFDEARNLSIVKRTVGHMPTVMWFERSLPDYGWRYLDPQGRRIGFISDSGVFGDEIVLEAGAHPVMFGPNGSDFNSPIVATDAGFVLDLQKNRRFATWTPTIDLIGIADDTAWQIANSKLVCFFPGHERGERWAALKGGNSKPGFIQGPAASHGNLIYMDPGRDVIGFVEGYDKIVEIQLPQGTGIRWMHVVTEDNIWFTGKRGQSLFKLNRKRIVKEYPCATPNSDLFRLDMGSDSLWFTEPSHNCLTYADISNL